MSVTRVATSVASHRAYFPILIAFAIGAFSIVDRGCSVARADVVPALGVQAGTPGATSDSTELDGGTVARVDPAGPQLEQGEPQTAAQLVTAVKAQWHMPKSVDDAEVDFALLVIALGMLSVACSAISNVVPGYTKGGAIIHAIALNITKTANAAKAVEGFIESIPKRPRSSLSGAAIALLAFGCLVGAPARAQTTEAAAPASSFTPCSKGSAVECTSGVAVSFTTIGYQKTNGKWQAVPTPGLGGGYQFRQGFFPDASGRPRFLLSELVFSTLGSAPGVDFKLAAAATVGYQWNGTSCSIGLAEDLFDISGGRSSGIFTPFTSLANTHWVIQLGLPIG